MRRTRYNERCRYAVRPDNLTGWRDCGQVTVREVNGEFYCCDHAQALTLAVR